MQVVARRQLPVLDRLISGTGAYVDPAYVKSGGVTHKSDVYSLGVVLFEVLCGRPAFVKAVKPDDVYLGISTYGYSIPWRKFQRLQNFDQPEGRKNEELVNIGTSTEMGSTQLLGNGNTQYALDPDNLAAKNNEPVQMGSRDLEYQAGRLDGLATTDLTSSTIIEARPLDHVESPDLEYQAGKHDEDVQPQSPVQMESLDLEYQVEKHDEHITAGPLSSATLEARSLSHAGSPDLEYQAEKHDEDVKPQSPVQMESLDMEYQVEKHDEHITAGPMSSTKLEARSLDQMRSLELQYQTEKHEEPITTLDHQSSTIVEAQSHDQLGFLDIENQAVKHDKHVQPQALVQIGSVDIENQEVKHDKNVQPQLIVQMGSLDREYSGKYDDHFPVGPSSSTTIETQSLDQTGSLNIKYQVEKHEELVSMDPLSSSIKESQSHDQMRSPDLEYQSGRQEELVMVELLPSTMKEDIPIDEMGLLDLKNQSGKHDHEYTQAPSFSQMELDLDLQAIKDYAYAPPLSRSMIEPSPYDQMPPSISDFSAPTLSDVRCRNMSTWNNLSNVAPGYSRAPSMSAMEKEEDYMITMRSLQRLHIPEDGLLATLAKSHYKNETLDDIIHPGLRKQMDPQSLNKYSEAAYCCLNEQRAQRPNIDRVILALKQALAFQVEQENSVLKERSTVEVKGTSTNQLEGKDFEHLKIGYDAIKSATDNFAPKYFLGRGGYGIVYKAELEHYDSSVLKDNEESELPKKRSTVAIKYILKREGPEGEKGFIAEIATLSSCKHPNIVSLLGFCHEDSHMILVYELVSNGSLADYLGNEGKMTTLTWVQRIRICIDIARGLDYVHTPMNEKGNKKRKIIHGDIKSANILLDENLNVKIADFGLSRLQPLNHTQSTIVTGTLVGTKMYWDPEYATSGHLKVESDVYSFGVVLFELMTGRLAYDPDYIKQNEKGLAPIVRQNFEQGTLKEMVDPKLKEESDGYGFTLSKGPNKDSLHTFSKIGYQCLSEKQEKRPKLKVIIKELEKALKLQETHKDGLRISLEDIQRATQNFSDRNFIGGGGFGRVYKGEILHDKEPTPIAVKRLDKRHGQGEQEFLTEVEILFEYKHENIISFVGYCNEKDESISVFEYASTGSLDRHLNNPSLTWTKRLMICIDVATGLDFLHGGGSTQAAVIHRDIKSSNILLTSDWKAKISDFGLSIITAIDDEMDVEFDEACGTPGYVDPQYLKQGSFTRESDIYSLGVVLFEMMSGRLASVRDRHGEMLIPSVKRHYEEGKLDELVFEDKKNMIVPESLAAYQSIAYECLQEDREKRPKASQVVAKLKEALEIQEDIEIWEPKLPKDYKEIIQMSKTPEKYSNLRIKDLYETFSNGILLQKGKVLFSLSSNEERHEMVSATMFSYDNNILHKRISIQNSRFQKVVKMMDISNLNIQIKIKTQFLTPNVIYGAHVVFKFCDRRKISSKLMYVNLKYKMKGKTLHAYFATRGSEEWMMIELCRFVPHKKDVDFEVLLESLSHYYCGSGAIYVEGLHFQAIEDATSEGAERVLKSTSDSVEQQETHEDGLRISIEDIKLATRDFSEENIIGRGGFGRVYKGEILHDKERTPIAVKRLDKRHGPGEQQFVTEVKILFEYKHDNIISFVGYCNENDESISVFEYASLGGLDRHLNNPSLTWTKRLMICIDVATGLDFLHGGGSTQAAVIHKDIKSSSILLTGDWKAKISDFGLSIITAIDDEMDVEFDEACGTPGYVDLQCLKQGSFTRESDIYSLGVVLFEMMSGRLASVHDRHGEMLIPSVKRHYEEGKLDELVFEDIKNMIVPESLAAYQSIAYECLQEDREKRPKASKVVAKLKEALEIQGTGRVLKSTSDSVQQVSVDYEEITEVENGVELLSLSKADDKKCHMLPAKVVLYDTSDVNRFNWKSLSESRFHEAVELLSHQVLRIKCKIETQKLSAETDYACYLVFKLSQQCPGLHCPVRVQDLLLRKNKESKFIYFRSPRVVNLHGNERVPRNREDGLMEVIVWEFKSGNNDHHVPMSLKLRCYEGTMSGLIVYGIEFRPI